MKEKVYSVSVIAALPRHLVEGNGVARWVFRKLWKSGRRNWSVGEIWALLKVIDGCFVIARASFRKYQDGRSFGQSRKIEIYNIPPFIREDIIKQVKEKNYEEEIN